MTAKSLKLDCVHALFASMWKAPLPDELEHDSAKEA